MKILVAHNRYQQRGGEDAVVEAEARLLESHGHSVVYYLRDNDQLKNHGICAAIDAGMQTIWSEKSLKAITEVIEREKPDVCHFHNTFPLISPASYRPCIERRIPVIQTLHNYRLLCPGATFFREGRVCEDCLGRGVPWPAVAHACYRHDRLATAAVTAMIATHQMLGTWQNNVNLFIALSEFAREKYIDGGLPKDRIFVKPNFVYPDPGPKRGCGEYALFIGRLTEEKGLRVLLDAWASLRPGIPLHIVGEGPLKAELQKRIHDGNLAVNIVGRLSSEETLHRLHGARLLIVPSLWYEGFPMAIAEAFACGVPVIASRLGSLEEIVHDGVTGLNFETGNSEDLAAKVDWAWEHPVELQTMGGMARKEYESKYSAEQNYRQMLRLWSHLGITAS